MPSTFPLRDIPGGKSLLDWFGRVPGFHDAELFELRFPERGSGTLRIHAWNMTNKVDANGYFICDRHAIVTLSLRGVSAIQCTDFDMVPGIISDLEITKVDEYFRVEWSASYGVTGLITARHARIDLSPGKPSLDCL